MEISEGKEDAFLGTMGPFTDITRARLTGDVCRVNAQLRDSQGSELRAKVALFFQCPFRFQCRIIDGIFGVIVESSESMEGNKLGSCSSYVRTILG